MCRLLGISISNLIVSSVVSVRWNQEIANGAVVDYATMRRSYSFMARLVMDGAFRCGGSVVAEK